MIVVTLRQIHLSSRWSSRCPRAPHLRVSGLKGAVHRRNRRNARGVRIREHLADKRKRSLRPLGRHRKETHNGHDFIKCMILLCEGKTHGAFCIHACSSANSRDGRVSTTSDFCHSFHCVSCETLCSSHSVYYFLTECVSLLNGCRIVGLSFGADKAAQSCVCTY